MKPGFKFDSTVLQQHYPRKWDLVSLVRALLAAVQDVVTVWLWHCTHNV